MQSSRRLEHEAGRNVEVMWLTGRLVPDHKTIADFRKDNGSAIRKVCAQFIALCRAMGLLTQAASHINGRQFKAVNDRDKNFTRAKMDRRMARIEESVGALFQQLDTADRQEPVKGAANQDEPPQREDRDAKAAVQRLEIIKLDMLVTPDRQIVDLTNPMPDR